MTFAAEPLTTTGLSFAYGSGGDVISGMDLTFPAGSVTAITGESGRGKSTLLYLLGLMLKPTTGDVRIFGESTARASDSARARQRASKIGFIFQDAMLDPTRTVLDNITESAIYRGDDPRSLKKQADILLREMNVSVPVKRKPTQVSGGQAQRIALCRALIHNPSIILADEPTGNLDNKTTQVVFGSLRLRATRGATVIIVTHSESLAGECDRRIEL